MNKRKNKGGKMMRLICNNPTPRKPLENFPWELIQLATLNGLSAADIVKLARGRQGNG